nr:MAG TPA: hypothetical protein [Caudoviricetes sp.]
MRVQILLPLPKEKSRETIENQRFFGFFLFPSISDSPNRNPEIPEKSGVFLGYAVEKAWKNF